MYSELLPGSVVEAIARDYKPTPFPFVEFPKMARLSRQCVITEKLDGTNAQVYIVALPDDQVMPTDTPIVAVVGHSPSLLIYAGSRTRWITPENDNYGFAKWVRDNSVELAKLGPGNHFGEWWGAGIQRKYNTGEKRFSLFNVAKWACSENRPACCHVVPVLWEGLFDTGETEDIIIDLKLRGSVAAPGFMKPEGIVIWHEAARVMFKKTLENDEAPKSLINTQCAVS